MGELAIPILIAATATATIVSVQQQRKASKAQRRLNNIRSARERTKSVRRARAQRAELLAAGAATGASQSSAVVGGNASVLSQLQSNLNFLDQANALNNQSIRAQERAAIFGGVASLAGQAAASGIFSGGGTTGGDVGKTTGQVLPGGGVINAPIFP